MSALLLLKKTNRIANYGTITVDGKQSGCHKYKLNREKAIFLLNSGRDLLV